MLELILALNLRQQPQIKTPSANTDRTVKIARISREEQIRRRGEQIRRRKRS